jgi:hypothetical protein
MEAIRSSVEATPMPAEGEEPEIRALMPISMLNFEHAIVSVKDLRAAVQTQATAKPAAPGTTDDAPSTKQT